MSGKIVRLVIQDQEHVAPGDVLLSLTAMKMVRPFILRAPLSDSSCLYEEAQLSVPSRLEATNTGARN
jgi:hypothetical protein